MQVDIALEPGHGPAELADLGRLAEQAGISTLWITHDPQERDVFLLLGEVARATRRLRLGVMAISSFEMHPLRLASALLTLGEISAGGTSVVVGAGGAILAHSRVDVSRRVRAVRECVDILKDSGPERSLDYDGEIFNVQSYRPAWAVQGRPRVLVGANREQMLRMSARRAGAVLYFTVSGRRRSQAGHGPHAEFLPGSRPAQRGHRGRTRADHQRATRQPDPDGERCRARHPAGGLRALRARRRHAHVAWPA